MTRAIVAAGRALLLAAGGAALLLGGACRPPAVAGPPPSATAALTLMATAPASPSATALATAATTVIAAGRPTASAPPTPTAQATAAATRPPAAATPTDTPTPAPTFTPPPPPPAVAGEHLLWGRPVPASGPTWTEKSYPYGSTRGGMLRPHHGVEFVVPVGTPVLAVAPGTVVVAGDDSQTAYGPQTDFYGNLVVLAVAGAAEDAPVYALYGHLSAVSVAVGQVVAEGEMLGLSGESGVADGPHLHLEVRVGQNSYTATRNPLLWLRPLPETGVVAGRVVDAGGALLHEAPLVLRRVDGSAPFTATTSYAAGGPNADDVLAENFVLDDVEPGFYELVVDAGDGQQAVELWVYAGRINWVEIAVTP